MAKENTHLLFAFNCVESLDSGEIKKAISENIDAFYLGSIAPDIFYYAPDEETKSISDCLHGKEGNPTNRLVLNMLDAPYTIEDSVFCMGYLTHCALDIALHPVIYALSGNYYDPDPKKRELSVYMHRHLETSLDLLLGNRLRIYSIIKPRVLKRLSFEKAVSAECGSTGADPARILRRQLFYNRVFDSPSAYRIASMMHKWGVIKDMTILGLFYANIGDSGNSMSEDFEYRDIVTGELSRGSITSVFAEAENMALQMITALWQHHDGSVTIEEFEKIFPGQSLDTGRLGLSVSDAYKGWD